MYIRHLVAGFASIAFSCNSMAWAASGSALRSQTPRVDSGEAASSNAGSPHVYKIQASVSQEYVLGPGDVISITDMASEDDKAPVSVSPVLPDGTCVVGNCGVLRAAGHSLREMNDMVNEAAKKWFVNPQLLVNLAKQRPTKFYLLGELTKPGLYSVGGGSDQMPSSSGGGGQSNMSGGGAGNASASSTDTMVGEAVGSQVTVTAALQMAGGLKETADVRHIRVTRQAPKATYDVDLWKLMIDGDVSEDIVLQPGDVVYVPKGGAEIDIQSFGKVVNSSLKVRVIGLVNQPGLFMVSPDDDILSVIAKAGGFKQNAVRKYVLLARTNHDGTVSTEKVYMKKGITDANSPARQKVRPGDLVYVKTSPYKVIGNGAARIGPSMVSGIVMGLLVNRLTQP